MHPTDDKHPSLESVLLGRYRLEHRLGIGAGGETWRAIPLDGGEPVAIKIVSHAGIPSRETADLLREAAVLQSLRHPHVVRYLGVADLPGSLSTFLIMEYVEGGNFSDWIERHRPCSAADTVPLLLQMADALSFLHSCGVLHRDLKPANVLVRPVLGALPVLLVADFGISQPLTGGNVSETRPAGTPGYSPPETWRGLEVTSAADVYSLGAIAWHCLVGPRTSAENSSALPAPGELRRTLRSKVGLGWDPLIEVVVRMLSERPEDRPTLEEVRRILAPGNYRTEQGSPPPSPTAGIPNGPTSVAGPSPSAGRITGEWVAAPEVPEPTTTFHPERRQRTVGSVASPAGFWSRSGRVLGGLLAVGAGAACFVGVGWWANDLVSRAPTANSPQPNSVEATSLSAVTALPSQAPMANELLVAAGEIAQLLITVDEIEPLPKDAYLVVATAGSESVRSPLRQLTLSHVRSGEARVELWASSQRIGSIAVQLPPGVLVHAACRASGLPEAGLSCEVRRNPTAP